ncbi:MAG: LysM domain-containing protein [Chloroflexota bacterium]
MSENPPIKSTIESYRKRRGRLHPVLIWILAAVLIIGGISILVLSLKGGVGSITLFASKTPTPTITPSPTNTPLPTLTPTQTNTPTQTTTPTPSAPFYYVIQEGDSISSVAEKFGLGDNGVIQILLFNPVIDSVTQIIYVGQEILVPPPGWPMPTLTPWPEDAFPGTRITYFVLPGDSLGTIADKFRSTIEEIIKANPDLLEDETSLIYPGQLLIIPVNLVTAVPTSISTPTATPTP